jgi:hypothetical protein
MVLLQRCLIDHATVVTGIEDTNLWTDFSKTNPDIRPAVSKRFDHLLDLSSGAEPHSIFRGLLVIQIAVLNR